MLGLISEGIGKTLWWVSQDCRQSTIFPERHFPANSFSLRLGEVEMKDYKRSLQTLSPLLLAASRLASLATRNGELVHRLTGFGSPFQSLAPLKGEGSLSSGQSAFHQVKVLAASCRSVMNRGAFLKHLTKLFWGAVIYAFDYRLTHSVSELSGFTCTSSLTMKRGFADCGIENKQKKEI